MVRKIFVSALALIFAVPAISYANTAVTAATSTSATPSVRQVVDLSSAGWKFKLGGDDAAATQVDDSGWDSVTVPHTWNRLGAYAETRPADSNKTQGVGWYRLHFHAPAAQKGQHQYLDFAAVGAIADVWVNGIHVGQHRGAFSRFRFDVTDQWKPGADNLVVVKADNSKSSAKSSTDVLPLAGDFFVYGGIYRKVSLITAGSVGIDLLDFGGPGVYAHTVSVDPKVANISVLTRLRNSESSTERLSTLATILDAQGKVVARGLSAVKLAPGTGEVNQIVPVAKPHLWNGTEDPYLYTVSVEVRVGKHVVDRVEQPLGIRTFAFDPSTGFSLNGQPMQLHGVSRHQDRQGKGWALSPEDHAEDMALIKEIGANSIRMAHYQHADEWVGDADKAGMIAWAEVPFVSASSFDGSEGTPALFANAEQQIRELIRQDYNHPSIVMWSVGNEVDASALYMTGGKPAHPLKLLQDVNRIAKAEDPSRPTTFADCCEDAPYPTKPVEALAGTANLIGYNRYYGWYYGKATDVGAELDKLHAKHPTLPMGLSEYGAGGALSQYSDNPEGGNVTIIGRGQPESYESLYHEQSWAQLKERKYLFATWVWNMFDFASDMRSEGDSVDLNDKGLVEFDHKTKKDAFWFYKANWSKEPVLYLTDKRYIDRSYPVMDVKAYSNAGKVRLTMNGHDRGEVSCPNDVCVWKSVPLAPGANTATITASIAGKTLSDQAVWNGPAVAGGIHIKSGDMLVRTIGGVRYGSDTFFSGGQPNGTGSSTSVLALYSTWRQGDAFSYAIPVADGHWHVTLHTLEPGRDDTTANALMSVKANGQEVVSAFNVLKAAGGAHKAVTRKFDVEVQGGGLKLDFSATGGQAVVSAIDITP